MCVMAGTGNLVSDGALVLSALPHTELCRRVDAALLRAQTVLAVDLRLVTATSRAVWVHLPATLRHVGAGILIPLGLANFLVSLMHKVQCGVRNSGSSFSAL
jgi:hypothetical protein